MPDSAEPLSKFEQIYLKLGRRFSESLYNEVASAASLQPRPTVAKVLAFSFAGVVHALTIVVAIAGLALIMRGWPNFVVVLAGVLCIAIAWVLRPRVPKLQDEILSRQQFSALYGLTDRIADALGSSPVAGSSNSH